MIFFDINQKFYIEVFFEFIKNTLFFGKIIVKCNCIDIQ
jgi:hypothetical protein